MSTRAISSLLRLLSVLVITGVAMLVPFGAQAASARGDATAGVLYRPADPAQFAGYPRAVRLAHSGDANGDLIALFDVFIANTDRLLIYRSTDDGRSWSHLSTFADSAYDGRMCCPTLFELPRQMGDQAAGTLLLAESAGAAGTLEHEIKVFRSGDQGQTWTYLSSCARGEGGLWEPSFAIDRAGRLVCYFSDERQVQFSQFLGHVVSRDGGRSWSGETMDVGVPDGLTRPGMATVVPMPSGGYVMSFEVCGTPNCPVHIKLSDDGVHWGDPTDLGARVQTHDGVYAGRTPYIAIAGGADSPPELVLTSKGLFSSDDLPAAQSGRMLLVNRAGDAGGWSFIPSPAPVSPAGPDCANYSSALLTNPTGHSLVMLAAAGLDGGGCEIESGRTSLTAAPGGTPVMATPNA